MLMSFLEYLVKDHANLPEGLSALNVDMPVTLGGGNRLIPSRDTRSYYKTHRALYLAPNFHTKLFAGEHFDSPGDLHWSHASEDSLPRRLGHGFLEEASQELTRVWTIELFEENHVLEPGTAAKDCSSSTDLELQMLC